MRGSYTAPLAYERVAGEEPQRCSRKSGVADECVGAVQGGVRQL